MINEVSRQQLESIKEKARLNSSIEKLRTRLRNFTVINRQGELIGEVKDLILEPNHQINFVVSQTHSDRSRLFLVVSKLVQKVDPSNQSVIVDINKVEIEHFPEYITTETPGMEISEIPESSGTPDYEAVDENLTKDSNVFASTTPAANIDMFSMDVDTTTSSDQLADGQQDITSDMAIYPMANIDASSMDVVDSASTLASADMQEQPDQRMIGADTPEVLEEELIRLLGERLIVDRSKRKIGEVIVRKEIETRMVQVPVRYEKLIVEQVSPEHKQLAEIDLGQEEVSAIELTEAEISGAKLPATTSKSSDVGSSDNEFTVKGEFSSPKIASLLLNAIALERRSGCKKVRVEIVVEDAERQKIYQEWIKRSSGS